MPVLGAVIGAVGAIGGAAIASGGAKSAANAQAQSNQAAIDEQRRQFDQTRADLSPFTQAGTKALGGQADLLGLNGADKQQLAISSLRGSPLYNALFNNGQEALLQNASATGGLRGGNTQGALANFGRDTLATVINKQLADLGGLSTLGQNSAAQTGALGQQSATNIGNLLADTGAARAGAAATSAGSWAGALQSLGKIGSLLGNSGNSRYGSLTSALDGVSLGPITPNLGNIDVGGISAIGAGLRSTTDGIGGNFPSVTGALPQSPWVKF